MKFHRYINWIFYVYIKFKTCPSKYFNKQLISKKDALIINLPSYSII